MRNLLVYYLLLMGLIFYCGSPTFAADWFCDFEQSEGYLPGVINGQNGWWASSSVPSVIADGSAPSGSQVLYMAGPTEGGNAVGYPNATAGLVKCTAYINGPTGAAGHAGMHWRQGSTYFIMSEFQEAGDAGWGTFNYDGGDGNGWAGDASGKITWNAGTWEELIIWLDLTNDQFSVTINGVLIQHWYDNGGALISTNTWRPFKASVGAFDTWQFFIGTMNGSGTPYKIDRLMVEEVNLNPDVTVKQAGIMLEWESTPGLQYSIYSTDDPSVEWDLVDQVTADSSLTQWIDTGDTVRENPASGVVKKRYYRIQD